MNFFASIVLGIVQGLTEFLPVSSSGHLVVIQSFLGATDQTIFFEVLLHFATLLAIIVFFRKKIVRLSRKEIKLLAISAIPVGAVGFLFNDQIAVAYSNAKLAAGLLFISGIINYLISKRLNSPKADNSSADQHPEVSNFQALKIGMYQLAAVAPGISRSGTTVLGGLNQGLNRFQAFEFSFLMALPVIFGANINELRKIENLATLEIGLSVAAAGFIAAFLAGLASLWLLKMVIEKAKFNYFAFYCWSASIVMLILL